MPEVNATFESGVLASGAGLVAPILRGADHKRLPELFAEIRTLAERARAG